LASDVAPKSIIFNPANGGYYNLTGSNIYHLMLSGPVPIILDGDATISAYLGGSGQLVKSGPGTLTLTVANTNTGPVVISEGRVIAGISPWYSPRSIGSGSLTISNGATIEFTGTHGFGDDASGRSATLNNGTLQFDHENYVSGLTMTAGSIVGAGEMRTPGNVTYTFNAASAASLISVPVNLVSGNATFNVARGTSAADFVSSGNNYGGYGFTKSGAGIMVMSGASTYTGATAINAGTLQLDGSLGTNTVSVANTATLSGTGVIGGNATISSGGTLAPGDAAIGTIQFNTNLTLNAGSKTVLELSKSSSGVLSNDLVSVLWTLKLGGTLIVSNVGFIALAPGDSFDLFNAGAMSGNFSSKTLPALLPGLYWDVSQLTNNGVITVTSVPPAIGGITAIGGGGFAVGGTGGAGQTYILLGATNLVPPIVWQPVATNAADVNGIFNLMDTQATNFPSRFYRVTTP
jgi:autotransporter-associated beta strand protein